MNHCQQQWESYAKHKHNDCPEHVHQQVAGCHDDDQTNHWVVPLESPCCPLAVRTVHKDAKCCRNCSKSTNHLYRVKNSDDEEDDKSGQEVVCLVVIQIVDHTVRPFVGILHVWHLEARRLQ